MAYEVDFENVSTIGLESSPVAGTLAGLRANEARYFKNKYGHAFAVEPARKAQETIDWVHESLRRSATWSSSPARSRQRRFRSRTFAFRTCSTRAASRST